MSYVDERIDPKTFKSNDEFFEAVQNRFNELYRTYYPQYMATKKF